MPIFAILFWGSLAIATAMSITGLAMAWSASRRASIGMWIVGLLCFAIAGAAFWYAWAIAHMKYGPGP